MPVRAAPAACVTLCACMTASAQTTPLPMALCAGWQGERVCELLHEDAQMRVLRCTFPPGVGHELHYHPPHFGYVLEVGRIVMADTCARLMQKEDIKEFYLGIKEQGARGQRRWKKRKTWR